MGLAPEGARDVIAVDVPAPSGCAYPDLESTGMAAESGHPLPTDLAFKRNLALLLARLAGWERIALVDDDIQLPDPHVLSRAAQLLDRVHAAGPSIEWFPDGSVVSHADRLLGGSTHKYITSAFVVTPDRTRSFFPHIYNEDWFYLVGDRSLLPVSLVGTASQLPYDPFATPDRARREEFGEVLAVGVHWLLERGGSLDLSGEPEFWRRYIELRRRHLDRLLARVHHRRGELPRAAVVAAALTAARQTLERVTPQACVAFIAGWRRDRVRWREHLRRLPTGLAPDRALAELGLREVRWAGR